MRPELGVFPILARKCPITDFLVRHTNAPDTHTRARCHAMEILCLKNFHSFVDFYRARVHIQNTACMTSKEIRISRL